MKMVVASLLMVATLATAQAAEYKLSSFVVKGDKGAMADGSAIPSTSEEWVISTDGSKSAADYEGLRAAIKSAVGRVSLRFVGKAPLQPEGLKGMMKITSLDLSAFEEIPDRFMQQTISLTYLKLSPNTTMIGSYAFHSCNQLTTVEGLGEERNPKKKYFIIKDSAFAACQSLWNIDCKNVTEVGRRGFFNTNKLQELDLSSATAFGTDVIAASGNNPVVMTKLVMNAAGHFTLSEYGILPGQIAGDRLSAESNIFGRNFKTEQCVITLNKDKVGGKGSPKADKGASTWLGKSWKAIEVK